MDLGVGGQGETGSVGAGGGVAGVPQFGQNFPSNSVPQFAQRTGKGLPQDGQTLASGDKLAPHAGHGRYGEPHPGQNFAPGAMGAEQL